MFDKKFFPFKYLNASAKIFCLSLVLLQAALPSKAQPESDTTSYVQTLNITTGKIDTILAANGDYEAPNWHPGNYLVMNF